MNRRRLILAGGTVVLTAIGVVRRNRRPPYVPLQQARTRAVAAVPLLTFGALWAPQQWSTDWLSNVFFGLFDPIIAPIKSFVLAVGNWVGQRVTDLLNIVEHAWNEAWEVVTGAYQEMAEKFTYVNNAIGGVITKTWDGVEAAFSHFRQQLTGWLENGYNVIQDVITEKIPGILRGILGGAWDIIEALAGIGMDGIAFLINLIDDPINFLWDLLRDVVGDAIDMAIEAAGFGLDLAAQIVEQGVSILMGGVTNFFDVMRAIWHILEWIAAHVDDFTVGSLEMILNPSWQSIQQDIVDTVDENIDSFEALVRRVFGLSDVQ